MMIISSPFLVNLTCFPQRTSRLFQILDRFKEYHVKHVSKAGKVDPGGRVTLPVKFACKPELTLTRLLG